jgi:tRNA(Arg) A34 adenosine deaminase TadA
MTEGLTAQDFARLRRAIELADESATAGNRPFGAVVARSTGEIVAEANSQHTANLRDWTAHSEMTALRRASSLLEWNELGDCTLYASAEPCPMCASAAYWCNMSRVVFGVSEQSLRKLRGGHPRAAGLPISAHTILGAAPRSIAVVGPVLEHEAIEAHQRFWSIAPREA